MRAQLASIVRSPAELITVAVAAVILTGAYLTSDLGPAGQDASTDTPTAAAEQQQRRNLVSAYVAGKSSARSTPPGSGETQGSGGTPQPGVSGWPAAPQGALSPWITVGEPGVAPSTAPGAAPVTGAPNAVPGQTPSQSPAISTPGSNAPAPTATTTSSAPAPAQTSRSGVTDRPSSQPPPTEPQPTATETTNASAGESTATTEATPDASGPDTAAADTTGPAAPAPVAKNATAAEVTAVDAQKRADVARPQSAQDQPSSIAD